MSDTRKPQLPNPSVPNVPLTTPIVLPTQPPIGSFIRIAKQPEEQADEVVSYSLIGNPVYSNLTFEANEIAGTPEIVINDVLLTVSQTRNIVTTAVSGRNGTIKEYISDGDFVINAKILAVTNQPNVAPYDIIRQLAALFTVQKEIEVVSTLLQIFNIDSVVIRDYEISEQQATRNVIPINLNMISDEPIEIKLNA